MKLYRRSDALLTQGLVVLVGIGVPLVSLGVPLWTWLTNGPLRWELTAPGGTRVTGLQPRTGVSLRGADAVTARIADAGAGTWLVSLLPGLVLSVTAVVIAWQVLRLLRRIERRRPFVASSATALRVMALALFVGSVLAAYATGFADAYVADRALAGHDTGMSVELSFAPFVAAMVLLALAEAFAHGARLQDDVEGLV